jgi:hypothetical protein
MPCDGSANDANGERGDTYLPGRKISVTRSLKNWARSMGSQRVAAGSLAIQSVVWAVNRTGSADAAAGDGTSGVPLHRNFTSYLAAVVLDNSMTG